MRYVILKIKLKIKRTQIYNFWIICNFWIKFIISEGKRLIIKNSNL